MELDVHTQVFKKVKPQNRLFLSDLCHVGWHIQPPSLHWYIHTQYTVLPSGWQHQLTNTQKGFTAFFVSSDSCACVLLKPWDFSMRSRCGRSPHRRNFPDTVSQGRKHFHDKVLSQWFIFWFDALAPWHNDDDDDDDEIWTYRDPWDQIGSRLIT